MITKHHSANLEILNKPITSIKLIVKNVPALRRWDIQEEEEFELQIKFHCYRLSDSFTLQIYALYLQHNKKLYIFSRANFYHLYTAQCSDIAKITKSSLWMKF